MRPVAAGCAEDATAAAVRVGAAGLVVAVLVVIPAVHAASDRLAAQAVRATAAERYVVIVFLCGRLS
jgi:hypothetical protein